MKEKYIISATLFLMLFYSSAIYCQQIKYKELPSKNSSDGKNSIDTVLRFAPGDIVKMTFNSKESFGLFVSKYNGKKLLDYKKNRNMITSLKFTVDTFCFYSFKFSDCPENFDFKIKRKAGNKEYLDYSIKPKWEYEIYTEEKKEKQNVPLIKDKVKLPARNQNNPQKYTPAIIEVNIPENTSKWFYKLLITDEFAYLSENSYGQNLFNENANYLIDDSIDILIFQGTFIDSLSNIAPSDSIIRYYQYKNQMIFPGSKFLIEDPKQEVLAQSGKKYYVVLFNKNHYKDVYARIAIYAKLFEKKTRRIPVYY
jgi:hypothetical protein